MRQLNWKWGVYLSSLFKTVYDAILSAGEAIMAIYQTDFEVAMKDDHSPLTLADTRANEIIFTALKKAYPHYAILSEEAGDDKSRLDSDYCFIVDPLDGTKEFIKGTGEFTVNIALSYKGNPVMGMIYAPVLQKLYYALKGEGAWVENVRTGSVKKIRVSRKTSGLTWVGSRSHSTERETQLIESHTALISRVVTAGSSLKGCLVAEGRADIYYRFGLTSEWDTAAMQCIVEEAGGIFRQMDGSPMRYNRENPLNEKGFYVVNAKKNIWV
ncbi:MAG: 3'(2'),5'-bisphosphate nucleotidase CysQ [delta proteobacterium ML8_F1]|nr:MAG: 3'(2'),5'-bisphosphate nucleotidase CysQ [delta proteobacterium ML8_F1]